MKYKNHKNRLWPACLVLSVGLVTTSLFANAGFFEFIDEDAVQEQVEGRNTILTSSVTTSDSRFTYVAALRGIFILSRDQETGNLTEVGLLSGESYPGGADNVSVDPTHIALSPDSKLLYMAGYFGYTSGGVEGDAPIKWQQTVVKFVRDVDTGSLTFDDHVDLTELRTKSISEMALSKDGSRLLFARANGNPGTTDMFVVNTTNMEPLFTIPDNQFDDTVLPASTDLKIALSPDERTVFLGGPVFNQRKNIVPAMAVIEFDRNSNRLTVKQTINENFFEGLDITTDISDKNVLSSIVSILPSDDGNFLYTLASIDTSEQSSTQLSAIGLWRVEDDGTLNLVRSMDKQELVFDNIGGTGRFSGSTRIRVG